LRLRIATVLAALLVVAGLLAGCGEDDGGGGGSTTTVTTDTGDDESPEGNGGGGAHGGAFDAQAVYEEAAPGVVTVFSIFGGGESAADILGGGGGAGQGSGFVVSDDGEIVTNAHVVTDGQAVVEQGDAPADIDEAREVYVQFPDRNSVPAEILGVDPFSDIALIKVDPAGLDIEPVEFGDIDEVEVGAGVAAIGSPFDERQSLSVGIVSQLGRSIPSLTSFRIEGAIQTDASINPGNSGGPLLNAAGEVIGVNQQIDTTSGGNQGVGFAVPVDLVTRSIEQLREDGEAEYAFVGVGTKPLFPQLAEELDIDAESGAIVERIEPNSPAEEAGLRAGDQNIEFQAIPYRVGGDVIVSIDGEEIVTESDLSRLVALKRPGDEVTLGVIRDGEEIEVDLTLGTRPSGPA
jgi:S1-C subfamily serine protease